MPEVELTLQKIVAVIDTNLTEAAFLAGLDQRLVDAVQDAMLEVVNRLGGTVMRWHSHLPGLALEETESERLARRARG